MKDIIIFIIIAILVFLAVRYIHRAKKRGQACIGCPNAKTCGKTSCGTEKNNK